MTKCHPFCGAKLTTRLKLLVAFDAILSSIAIQLSIITIAFTLRDYDTLDSTRPRTSHPIKDLRISTVLLLACMMVLNMMLDAWLWIIVPKKDKTRTKVWLIMKMSFESCETIGFFVELILGHHTSTYTLLMFLYFTFTTYFIWTVYFFMMEIENIKGIGNLDGNTNKFVKFFKNGGSLKRGGSLDEEVSSLQTVLDD